MTIDYLLQIVIGLAAKADGKPCELRDMSSVSRETLGPEGNQRIMPDLPISSNEMTVTGITASHLVMTVRRDSRSDMWRW